MHADQGNRIEAPQGEAILLGELKQRSDQLGINCRWLIDKIDRIHRILCPDQCGTWQQRAEQAVEAAERLSLDESFRLIIAYLIILAI